MGFFDKLFNRKKNQFTDSASYWEERYSKGRTSGSGSYGNLAEFKARVLNDFVEGNHVESVVEFGCGDGNQLTLAKYPSYVGYDVSNTAIDKCRNIFSGDPSKKFRHVSEYAGEQYDLSLSLDVIYHLVEDDVFDRYMKDLFGSAKEFVIIYSNDKEEVPGLTKPHVRWRKFSRWVETNEKDWSLLKVVKNAYPEDSVSDFFIYKKSADR